MTPSPSDPRVWSVLDAVHIDGPRTLLTLERPMRRDEVRVLSRGRWHMTITHGEGMGLDAYAGDVRIVRSGPLDGHEVALVEVPASVDVRRSDSVRVAVVRL
jgi:hypothetical protein